MKSNKRIKVAFTKAQHQKVHAFLDFMRQSGKVEKDLGAPISVAVDWSPEVSAVIFTGITGLTKTIPLQKILEADDSKVKGPVLKLVPDHH